MREIEILNNIIVEAIRCGGDDGGPYFSNEEKLLEYIENWIWEKNLQDEFCVEIIDGFPQIIEKKWAF